MSELPDDYYEPAVCKTPLPRPSYEELLSASQAREAELRKKLERLQQDFTDHNNASDATIGQYKQRAEAAEAQIKASREREPRAFAVCGEAGDILNVATSRDAYGRDDDLSELQLHIIPLYEQPPITPELAEFQRENAELRKLLEESKVPEDAFQKEVYAWAKSAGIFDANHLDKIQDELAKLTESPGDESEMADVFLALILHAEQFGCLNLIGAVRRKFEVVKTRTYGEPDERGVVRHISPQPKEPKQ